MTLHIPVITDDMDVTQAALAYANAGWYVVPVKHDTKSPTVLGKGWHHQSSREADQIVAWFAGTNHALGLHVGRSGAIVFDVDEPDMIPAVLQHAIETEAPPYQSTRVDVLNRGHFVFTVPPGRHLGNGRGQVLHPEHKAKWGEVRGANGIIVAQPSEHTKPGGRYQWQGFDGDEPMEVPELPSEVADLLPDASPALDAANDDVVAAFLNTHREASAPHYIKPILAAFERDLAGQSRHEALVSAAAWAMRDARAGVIDAQVAHDTLQSMFMDAMKGEAGHGRFPSSEFRGVIAWAVGQALAIDPAERAEQVAERTAEKPKQDIGADWTTLDPTEPGVVTKAAPAVERQRDSDDYWYRDFLLNRMDVDSEMLLKDVVGVGPLAIARDHRFWSYQDGVWREDNLVVRKRVIDCMRKRVKPNHWTLVEQMLQVPGIVPALEGDPTPSMINFRNGMLDWQSGALLPHGPAYKSTVQLPVAWDAEADCPRFDAWLRSILTPDYVDLAWQMIGYLMMSGNPLQVAFLMLGKGGNGKGTLMRVIKALLGDDNTSAISLDDLSGNRFAPAGLYGMIANLAGDIDSTFQESTAKFKMLTGEDTFTAENKNQAAFRFTNWAVPVFSANKIFGSSDTTEGYLRRWIIMKFDVSVPAHERIVGLDQQFLGELPGIARRGVEALHVLMENGHFKDDGDVNEGKAEFTESLDQVRQWVSDCAEPEFDGSEERTALYSSYKIWSHNVGVGTLSAKEFYNRLDGAGYPAVKVHGVRRHKGLRVTAIRMMSDPMLTES